MVPFFRICKICGIRPHFVSFIPFLFVKIAFYKIYTMLQRVIFIVHDCSKLACLWKIHSIYDEFCYVLTVDYVFQTSWDVSFMGMALKSCLVNSSFSIVMQQFHRYFHPIRNDITFLMLKSFTLASILLTAHHVA